MSSKAEHLLKRFPDLKSKILELIQTNDAFEALAHRHGEVSDRLSRFSKDEAEESVEADELRRRRAALEEEMMIIMEQNFRF